MLDTRHQLLQGKYRMSHPNTDQAIAQAYLSVLSGAYTMAEIGGHFGIRHMTASCAAVWKLEEKSR